MANFKLQSIFRGYKRLFGMTAEVYNENGDLLDSVDINNSRKRVSFSFDKEDALLGNNRSDVTIKLIDENGNARNFKRGRSAEFDLNDDEQTFTTSISSRKRRQRMRIKPSTQNLDNQGPVSTPAMPAPLTKTLAKVWLSIALKQAMTLETR